jgi:uncharacterized protein (TIGR00725 family)
MTATESDALVPRLEVVGVIGSGDPGRAVSSLPFEIGRLVARAGHHLLTGGGQGVMADACRGFASVSDHRGRSIAILPRGLDGTGPRGGYPNPWVEIPVLTHLAGEDGPESASSRNPINVLSARRLVALPGGSGTIAELRLAVRYGRPVFAVQEAGRQAEPAFERAVGELGFKVWTLAPASGAGSPGWRALEAFIRGSVC